MSVLATSYEGLRRMVVEGELLPGELLGEVRLAEMLGVSRSTLREALRRLEGDGLAVSDGRHLRVARMNDGTLRSALLMRASLEGLHAELLAMRSAEGLVAPVLWRRLDDLADEALEAVERGAPVESADANRRLHQAIDGLAQCPVSAAALDRLWDRIIIATERSAADLPDYELGDAEHRALLAALRAGDPKRARDIAVAHVRAVIPAALDGPAPGPDGCL